MIRVDASKLRVSLQAESTSEHGAGLTHAGLTHVGLTHAGLTHAGLTHVGLTHVGLTVKTWYD